MGTGHVREDQDQPTRTVHSMAARKSAKKPASRKPKAAKKKATKKKTAKKKSSSKKSARKTTKKKTSKKKAAPKATKKKTAKKSPKKTTRKTSTRKTRTTKKKTSKKTTKKAGRKKTATRKTAKQKSTKKRTTTTRSTTTGKKTAKKKSASRAKRKTSAGNTGASTMLEKRRTVKKKKRKKRLKKKVIVSMFEAQPPKSPPPQASQVSNAALDLFEKGMKAFHNKKFEQAETHFQAIQEGFPGEQELRARVRMYLRVCDQHLGDTERKYKTPHDHYYRAVILANRGRHLEALKHLDSALRMVRRRKASRISEDQVHFVTAGCHSMLGDAEKSYKSLVKAIELNGRNRALAFNSPDFENLRNDAKRGPLLFTLSEEEE